MRIKRIVALVLSAVLLCFSLVGCEEAIGDYLEHYTWKPKVVKNVYYDFYIVVGDEASDDMAKTTVNDKLNQIFGDNYNTKINIKYLSEAEYETVLQADLASTTAPVVPDGYYYGGKIVLIKDYSMMTYLADKLAPLDTYLATNKFGTLNAQITDTLLTAAEYIVGEGDDAVSKGTLAIPNNRIFGTYEYIVINRAVAETQYAFSAQSELLNITTLEDAEELISVTGAIEGQEIDVNGKPQTFYAMPDGTRLLYTATGDHALKKAIETLDNGNWICNVSEYPIATAEEAYASAFGVIPAANLIENEVTKVDGNDVTVQKVAIDCVERAMEIIYAINTDVTVRNTLLYGVENTNFLLSEDGFVTPITNAGSNYNMKLEYTGDVLKAYYLNGVWTPEMATNTQNHNSESVLPD